MVEGQGAILKAYDFLLERVGILLTHYEIGIVDVEVDPVISASGRLGYPQPLALIDSLLFEFLLSLWTIMFPQVVLAVFPHIGSTPTWVLLQSLVSL
jgi:hypothetical protein